MYPFYPKFTSCTLETPIFTSKYVGILIVSQIHLKNPSVTQLGIIKGLCPLYRRAFVVELPPWRPTMVVEWRRRHIVFLYRKTIPTIPISLNLFKN